MIPHMKDTKTLRLGIIGLGLMGSTHANSVLNGSVPGCLLAATCDPLPDAGTKFEGVPHFTSAADLLASGEVDAVLISTPHYDHTPIGIAALQAGLHVLVEKPISVHKADAMQLLSAHRSKDQVFAAMFNQRTDPRYIKLRDLLRNGELGKVQRISWIITDWFRPEAYYRHAGWRATWEGEGGGVLLNQCPHNLDLLQWIFGMPTKVRGFCQLGRHHRIEVEDEATAYLEYSDGATCVFTTSTGEAPGTNRLEVAGDRGRVVLEDGKMTFLRNEVPTREFSLATKEKFAAPPVWNISIPLPAGHGAQHLGILMNFTNAILHGEPLIAPASEGIHSVELANAILQSSLEERTISLPMDGEAYRHLLEKLKLQSKEKNTTT
jgi:predicted dehydrogenase